MPNTVGVLIGWGAGHTGIMGSGPAEDQLTPHPVSGLGRVSKVCAGESTVYALDDNGRVLSWGWDAFHHLLGRGEVQYPQPLLPSTLRAMGHEFTGSTEGDGGVGLPVVVKSLPEIVRVVTGQENVYALSSSGEVWCWGAKDGLGRKGRKPAADPLKIGALPRIVDIAASPGGFCCYALDEGGGVWSWGKGFEGELGHGKLECRWVPEVVTALDGVSSVHAGDFMGWAVLDDGSVRFWGNGQAIGLTQRGSYRIKTPVTIEELSPAATLYSGPGACVTRLRSGDLVGIGVSLRSMLGLSVNEEGVFPATPLHNMVGVSLSTHHGLAWNDKGAIFAFGSSELGALGLGLDVEEVFDPTPIPGIGPVRFALAGNDFSLAIAE